MNAGLRTKLLVPTVGAVILCMGLASYFSSRKASEQIWSELLSASSNIVRGLEQGLSIFVEDLEGVMAIAATNEKISRFAAPDADIAAWKGDTVAALQDLAKFDESIQGINLLNANGDVLASAHDDKGNFSDRQYFKRAMAGETNVSEPLVSRITGAPVFMVATPVKVKGTVAGVLYARVDLAKFSKDMIEPVTVGQGGYAYIVDKAGLVFSHPDKSKVLALNISETDWGRKLLSMGNGLLSYSVDGEEKTAVFSRSKSTGWTTVVTVNAQDISRATGAVRDASLLFGGAGIALVSLAVFLIVRQMLGSLNRCVAFAGAVAGGDLDQALNLDRTDELGRLGGSLSVMVARLKEMIETARRKTGEAEEQAAIAHQAVEQAEEARRRAETARIEGMRDAAGKLEGVTAVLNSASGELSGEINRCAGSSHNQSQRIGETAAAMEEMNATILEVARNSSEAADTSAKARAKAEEGSRIVSRVVAEIEQVAAQSRELKQDMDALGAQAEGIGRILNVISDIADQTNLLALNAAIEAARAGEAGRGFAVVADEVRKLAEKTMSATKEVGEAIAAVQQGTLKNVRNVERSVGTIQEATALAGQSGASLSEIVSLVEMAADQVRAIATAAEEQSSASEEITRNVEDINRMSQEVFGSMEQASLAVSELAGQTRALRSLIEDLQGEGRGQVALSA